MREALKGSDIEAIKARNEELNQAFYAASEKMYQANASQGGAQGFDPNQAAGGTQDANGYYEAPYTDVTDDNN